MLDSTVLLHLLHHLLCVEGYAWIQVVWMEVPLVLVVLVPGGVD